MNAEMIMQFTPEAGTWPESTNQDVFAKLRSTIEERLRAGIPVQQVADAMADDASFISTSFDLSQDDPLRASFAAFVRDLTRIVAEDRTPRLRLVY